MNQMKNSKFFRLFSSELANIMTQKEHLIISKLTNRKILSFTNPNILYALDYLMSCSFRNFKEFEKRCVYGFILAKKKPIILADLFVYKPFLHEEPEIWIDVEESKEKFVAKLLEETCKKLNIQGHLEDVSDILKVYSMPMSSEETNKEGYVCNEIQNQSLINGNKESSSLIIFDPRTTDMGIRMVCCEEDINILDTSIELKKDKTRYDILRYISVIPEGKELEQRNPLSCSMHYLNAILAEKEVAKVVGLDKLIKMNERPRNQIFGFFIVKYDLLAKIRNQGMKLFQIPFLDEQFNEFLLYESVKTFNGLHIGTVISIQNNVGLMVADGKKFEKNQTKEIKIKKFTAYLIYPFEDDKNIVQPFSQYHEFDQRQNE